MIDINELREAIQTFGSQAINEGDLNELLDRLEAAEKERDDVALQLVQSEQGKRKISEECDALLAEIDRLKVENAKHIGALLAIADWGGVWGPFPERNESWRGMAVVRAREATKAFKHGES